MYVCVCNAITDRDISNAVAEGCCTLRQLREKLGVATCCGRCAGCARELLKAHRQVRSPCHPDAMQLETA